MFMSDTADRPLDTLSVNPDQPQSAPNAGNQERDPRQDAGQDESITRRLERNPESEDARLDNALDESMDASDPPASTQPVHNSGPAASSGFDEEAERKLREE
jgi:hypothetical protein